jgi:hypothetical protein
MPGKPVIYGLYLSVKTGWLPVTINGKRYYMELKERNL